MITNEQEFQAARERIEQFQRWLVQLRRSARPEEFEPVAGGYRLEIERMQAEAREEAALLAEAEKEALGPPSDKE